VQLASGTTDSLLSHPEPEHLGTGATEGCREAR